LTSINLRMRGSRFLRSQARALGMIGAVSALAVSGVISAAGSASAQPSANACAASHLPAQAKLHGKVLAAGTRAAFTGRAACSAATTSRASDPAVGAPPLLYWGGKVMATPLVHNRVVMTPIFWEPTGYKFAASYKNLIVQYLKDVAAASGSNNIFATNTEYSGKNGTVHYGIKVGTPIDDTTAFPTTGGCTPDSGPVYSDASGYSACVDDDQVTAETTSLLTSHNLPTDLGHMYLMFTPKHVESCFYSDAEAADAGGNQCTINASGPPPGGTAVYCAYHSYATNNANEIYGMMPFPIYNSPDRYTCGSQATLPTNESPNNNTDADVEISPLSHEMSEAITDPDLDAWSDAVGYENGDECAYTYGPTHGAKGKLYNQSINGHHYLTQEEFSNADFFTTYGHGGCVQGEPHPSIQRLAPRSGNHKGGTLVTITGRYFTPAARVLFGGKAGNTVKVSTPGQLTVHAPQHAKGKVKVVVTTIGGTSNAGHFTYK
jgi:hypothetical protein